MIWFVAALGAAAVAAGVVVFVADSMARVTYALCASFVAVGLLLLAVGLVYLAPLTILMMVMEMAVMGLFMIMFMGMNPALMAMDMTHAKRPSIAVAAVVFAALAAAVLLIPWPAQVPALAGDQVAALGTALMDSKMLVMLTVSPVLLATIVTAVVLANPRGRYDRLGDRLDARLPDDPEPGGLTR